MRRRGGAAARRRGGAAANAPVAGAGNGRRAEEPAGLTCDHRSTCATALQTREPKDRRFRIEGHTDAKVVADSNLRLSPQRVDEVRGCMQRHGVAGQRPSAVGRGMQQAANAARSLAAENRRVRVGNLE